MTEVAQEDTKNEDRQVCISLHGVSQEEYDYMISWCRQKTPLNKGGTITINVTFDQYHYIHDRREEDPDTDHLATVVREAVWLLCEILKENIKEKKTFFLTRLEFIRTGLLLHHLAKINPEPEQEKVSEEEYLKQLVRSVLHGGNGKKEDKETKSENPHAGETAGVGYNGGVYHR